MKNKELIVKASGVEEPFSQTKLKRSLVRAGSSNALAKDIIANIKKDVHRGVNTSQIHTNVLKMLRKDHIHTATRYNLRKAVMTLGPSGFPFEKFVAEILRAKGYKARVGVVLDGYCVNHEVDVLAEKDGRHVFIECKFHNKQDVKSDLKVILYVRARFEDIRSIHRRKEGTLRKVHEGWLVTNTKLTTKAIKYSKCVGMTAIGWNYPSKGNLQDLILEAGVHPITFLNTLTQNQKNELMKQGVVLCRSLSKNPDMLRSVGIVGRKQDKVMEEVNGVCGSV